MDMVTGTNIAQNFHICTVHLEFIKVFYSPTDAQVIVLKTILKFTLTLRRLMSYIYGAPILDVSRSRMGAPYIYMTLVA